MKKETKLNVLVACEYSGVVRDAFRRYGHEAWSCDLLPCDADPRYHLQRNVLEIIQPNKLTQALLNITQWDLMIAHPPCTYLCNSGVRWLTIRDSDDSMKIVNMDRWQKMIAAANFFGNLWRAKIPYIAIENPIMHRYGRAKIGANRPNQIIQPWQFGHGETKATCLWLKNLPPLVPTDIVSGRAHNIHRMAPGPDRAKMRSRTFEGIADAMAQQWSQYIKQMKIIESKSEPSKKPRIFPWIGESKSMGIIVLFTDAKGGGVCLKSGFGNTEGTYEPNWSIDVYAPYEGALTILND